MTTITSPEMNDALNALRANVKLIGEQARDAGHRLCFTSRHVPPYINEGSKVLVISWDEPYGNTRVKVDDTMFGYPWQDVLQASANPDLANYMPPAPHSWEHALIHAEQQLYKYEEARMKEFLAEDDHDFNIAVRQGARMELLAAAGDLINNLTSERNRLAAERIRLMSEDADLVDLLPVSNEYLRVGTFIEIIETANELIRSQAQVRSLTSERDALREVVAEQEKALFKLPG